MNAEVSIQAAHGALPCADLPAALDGERVDLGPSGGLCCYVAGRGPPLLLVHSVNAVPSAAEMRPLFEHYRSTHTVFAPDLPGFGHSERSDRDYTPRLMTDALHSVTALARNRCGGLPVNGLAVSLGCEFLARAALERPASFGRIALVSPTGLDGRRSRRGPPGSTYARPWLHALLSQTLWAKALYRGLTHPALIRYFLQRTWGSRAIDETLWAYDVRTARQPGARHAPLHFIAGSLFSRDIHHVYEALSMPVWLSHGMHGSFADFRALSQLTVNSVWRRSVFQTGAMPYFERPQAFCQAFDGFLERQSGSAASHHARAKSPESESVGALHPAVYARTAR